MKQTPSKRTHLLAYSDQELDQVADDIVKSSSSKNSSSTSLKDHERTHSESKSNCSAFSSNQSTTEIMGRRKLQQNLGEKLL